MGDASDYRGQDTIDFDDPARYHFTRVYTREQAEDYLANVIGSHCGYCGAEMRVEFWRTGFRPHSGLQYGEWASVCSESRDDGPGRRCETLRFAVSPDLPADAELD